MLIRWFSASPPRARYDTLGLEQLGGAFEPLERMLRPFERGSSELDAGLWPRMNLTDQGECYRLQAELPGVKPEDLELTVDADTIRLRGRRTNDVPAGHRVHARERGALDFERVLSIPRPIDASGAQASLADGMLTLELPKVPEARPRQIPVKTR